MIKSDLYNGDCLEVMKSMPDNSVDAIVSDPPYGLSFMGKKWDYDVPSIEIWTEALRVLKPGGHLLSFGGTRTYHRMVVNIEDAGFEIRDQIQWLYGSGFPKSHNISKAIDKKFGAEREVVGHKKLNPNDKKTYIPKTDSNILNYQSDKKSGMEITAPSTSLAKQWDGYGTALKPANEPIVLARKPLSEKTIVDNVLKWGTGGLNIDGCRVEGKPRTTHKDGNVVTCEAASGHMKGKKPHGPVPGAQGRFPANIILDEVAGQMLDEQSGISQSDSPNRKAKQGGHRDQYVGGKLKKPIFGDIYTDKGGASRFFYCAKASKSERNAGLEGREEKESTKQFMVGMTDVEHSDGIKRKNAPILNQNHHPTVKPIKLMKYLVTLITPPNGTVLDPFMGSGTTGIAAKNLDRHFIGIERDQTYFEIAKGRING